MLNMDIQSRARGNIDFLKDKMLSLSALWPLRFCPMGGVDQLQPVRKEGTQHNWIRPVQKPDRQAGRCWQICRII